MIRLAIVVFLTTLQLARGEVPRFFTSLNFTTADFARAVNHFVGLGEKGAVQELENLASKGNAYHMDKEGFYYNSRVGLMCRVLFEGRDGRALRPPKFGCLEDLPPPDLMETNWPLFPVAKSGSSYFVLSEGYITVSGETDLEDATNYIGYCRHNGIFRKRPVSVPAKRVALQDLAALRKSAAWNGIKWVYNYNGSRCSLDEGFIWKYIASQATSDKRRFE